MKTGYRLFLRGSVLILLLASLSTNFAVAQTTQDATNTDNSANMPGVKMGDVAGLIERTSSGDAVQFVSASARSQVNMAAQNLNAQLSQGELSASLSAGAVQPVDKRLAYILTTSNLQSTSEAVQEMAHQFIEQGLPVELAQELVESVSGLTAGGEVEAGRFIEAIQVYNDTVNEAPAAFLRAESQEFDALRTVLTSILEAAATK